MSFYVTRYALTDGIKEVDGSVSESGWLTCTYDHRWPRSFPSIDFSEDRDDAVLRAEEMRDKKIKSLKKQIEKLEALSF